MQRITGKSDKDWAAIEAAANKKRAADDPQAAFGDQGREADRAMLLERLAAREQMDPNQSELVKMMQARARGESPSVAELQMKEGIAQGQSAMQAAANQGAASAGLAQRLAMRGGAQLMGQGIAQGAMLRAQEQAQAEGRLGEMLLNQQAQLDQMTQYFLGQNMSLGEARREAQMRLQENVMNAELQRQQIEAGAAQAQAAQRQQLAMSGLQGVSTVGSMFTTGGAAQPQEYSL
jgi:hypothetical protein